ncbi:MAG: flagellar basal body-associated protein FliL [Betaproteobacteria bacterium]|jgi:flagellar FliL protein|uniref:Flagellar protein FliL n=1 Tax=Candidatus Proximibacter danicus TaxID=2954365 RepID=A0A9D7K1J4_9PROT|nr:flagellar basal body-associated protein FliL [Candidatus Proximibacter danicus]
MAKEEKAAEGAAEAAPKKSKKMLIIIIAAVLLLVVVGGGAAFFLMKKSSDPAEEGEVAAEKESAKKKGKESVPVYIPMEAFTVNLVPETGDQYLQVTINVEAEDAAVGEKLKIHMPKLRNKIMLILSSKKPSELAPREGKEQLAEEIKESINTIIGPSEPAKGKKTGEDPIKEVLFTSFIIQ